MPLEPPPPEIYRTRHELVTAVKRWAGTHGYATVIKSSNLRKGFVYIVCDCSGSRRNTHNLSPTTRQRERGSRRDNCLFLVVGRQSAGLWSLIVRVGAHNHQPTSPDSHPSLRRLDAGQRDVVSSLTVAGVSPRQIEAHLQQTRTTTERLPLMPRDLYNIRYQLRRESLNAQTPIQALLREFAADDFVHEYQLDTDGHVTHLFFASRRSLHLFLLYPEVLLLDCTYQTNRYGLPLLNMVGMTGVKLSFLVACAFLRSESEEDYRWVLERLALHIPSSPGVVVTDCDHALMNALGGVFPASFLILCRWHVRRSVQARCKSHFPSRRASSRRVRGASSSLLQTTVGESAVKDFMEDWDAVVYAESVQSYRTKWQRLQSTYRREASLIGYLRNTWLPLKEHFMAPWVDEHLHLGATETSRVEGFHAVLKQVMGVSYLQTPKSSIAYTCT